MAKTLDQAKAVMVFVDAVMQKINKSTISLTAARGRGKSAAVGMSVAAAIALGFSNIFVSAPSP
jgi:N-acetyltransferase 10